MLNRFPRGHRAARIVGATFISFASVTFGSSQVTSIAGGSLGQAQTVTLGFECLLTVQVFSGTTPVVGAHVVFASPAVGASALLTDALSSGSQLTEITDSNGMASVIATADVVPGSYVVSAMLTSGDSIAKPMTLASYSMNNLAIGESIFADGLEDIPALCGSFAG